MVDTPIQQIGDEYAAKVAESFEAWAEDAKASYPNIKPFDPTPILQEAMMAAGDAQLAELSGLVGFKVKFDLKSPEAIAWAKEYGAEQVKYVNASTKTAIRQITVRGLNDGLSPQAQKKAIKEIVGLLPQHVVAVQSYRESLLSSGMDSGSVDRLAAKYVDKLLRYRAGTIGLTESHTATNEGARQVNQDAVKRGVLAENEYLQEWLSAGDKRRCSRCGGLQGKTAKINGDFAGDGRGPPLHPRCRCTVVLVKNPEYKPITRIQDLIAGIDSKSLRYRPLSEERAAILAQANRDVLAARSKLTAFDLKKINPLGARFEAAVGKEQEALQVELEKLAVKRATLSNALAEKSLKVDRIRLSQVYSRGYDLSGFKIDGDLVDVSVTELNNGMRIIVNKEFADKSIYNPAVLFRKYEEMPDLLKSGIDDIYVLGRDGINPGWGLSGADASHSVDEIGRHYVTLYRPSGVGVFKHEAAHGLEQKMPRISGKMFSDSPMWVEAQKADVKYPSRYAKEGGNWEDFADSVDIFLSMPEKFKAACPNRSKILEEMFNVKD